MNRISRRSATDTADALLEAGRTEPVLDYDVELGLARHHHWLRNEAPMPEWAGASVGTAAKSLMPVVLKSLVSVLLVGGAIATWQALSGQSQQGNQEGRGAAPPSAASLQHSSRAADSTAATERDQKVAANDPDVVASEAWIAPRPIPVPELGSSEDQSEDQLERVPPRPDARTKHAPRSARTRKGKASTRAAVSRARPPAVTAPASVEPAGPTAPTNYRPSRGERGLSDLSDTNTERATHGEVRSQPSEHAEVAAAPERMPASAAQRARPEPAQQAQVPDDLLEMQQVATAEQLLERSPARALALVRQGDRRFAQGYFKQERAYVAIMALIRLGRLNEARARAAQFDRKFPALPYGARIRSALQEREAAAPGAAARDALP